jgi:hypothetical protein
LTDEIILRVAGTEVARYVHRPTLEPFLSPRPYFHPVRTLGGTVTTDAVPVDHRWHLGLSVAIQDVSKNNFWGGRTYVRDRGYVHLDDHGTIEHERWGERADDTFTESLRWIARDGSTPIVEERTVRASVTPEASSCWCLDLRYSLRNATETPLVLGSPATNGRAGGGYGGLFWRAPGSAGSIDVFTAAASGERAVHGTRSRWAAFGGDAGHPSSRYTLVLLAADDRAREDAWFVRVEAYPGIGSALAFEDPVVLGPDEQLARRLRIFVADGRWDQTGVANLLLRMGEGSP